MQQLLDGFRAGLVIAIVVIFLMLAANFQSLRLSVVVISTMPAVLAGVVLMLWLTHTTLNIQSAMGAILLVTFAERALTAAEATLRLTRERKEFAVGIVLENIQAEQELTRARNDYLGLIAEYNKAQYGLIKAVGSTGGLATQAK